MKKVYIFLTAICLVALTGCIKEDVDLTQANVSMSISTRAELSSSSEQGDAIGDINVWAFACDAQGNVSSDKAVAWRRISAANTHTSVDVHLQFATCDDEADHYYKLVAVINEGEFGTVSGITSFDRNTTYSQLANATFVATDLMAKTPGNGAGSTPGQMPISHWKIIKLNKDNNSSTHPDSCVEVSMPVYRAVAKTQLFVAKTDASTPLVIKNVTIGSSAFPKEGVLLSAAAGQTVEVENEDGTKTKIAGDLNPSNEPMWYNDITVGTETNNNASDNTYEMPLTLTTPNSIPVLSKDDHPAENSTSYAYVTSHFLYENKGGSTVWNTASTDGGYCMNVTYDITPDTANDDKTESVWLPAVVRNHDYQVRALVDAGGKLDLKLSVNDWTDAEKIPDVNYEDNVTIKGGLTWSGLGTNDSTHSTYTFGSNADQTATCSFTLETPKGGTWYAELAEGDINDFAFEITDENGTKTSKTVSGNITGKQASFTIKTLTQNSLDQRTKSVKLRLTAKTADGRMLTVYLGDDIDYYTIIQTQN